MQPPQTHNGTKFHSGSCSAVTRASTHHSLEKFARRRNPSSLASLQLAGFLLEIPSAARRILGSFVCPALREKGAPARRRSRTATCPFGVLLSSPPPLPPLVARSDHRLPHKTIPRPVDWTTYGSDPFRFSRPILPTRMESARITFLPHLCLWHEYRGDIPDDIPASYES